MDKEVAFGAESHLYGALPGTDRISSDGIMKDGAILLCRKGTAEITVNYKPFRMPEDSVMTLFPGDLVTTSGQSPDFSLDALVFSPSILREASLDLEQTVYSSLREDRCRGGSPIVSRIVSCMFGLLEAYFRQPDCTCLGRLVTCQLKAFFIGFHDYLIRFPGQAPPQDGSKRKRSLFDLFMRSLERDYRKSRDVGYYAGKLNITSKYLNMVSRSVAGHNAKAIIDHYVILKLKIDLRDGDKSLKQIVCDYNFSDASFFTRYFKQHTGITPLAYRKANYPAATSPSRKGIS